MSKLLSVSIMILNFLGTGLGGFTPLEAMEPRPPSFEKVAQLLKENLNVKPQSSQVVVVSFEQIKGHQYGTLRYGPTFWSFLPFYRCLNNELDECRVEVAFHPSQTISLDSYAANYLSEDRLLAEHLCPLRLVADPRDGGVQVFVATDYLDGELWERSPESAVWVERSQRDREVRLSAALPFNPNPEAFKGSEVMVVCNYRIGAQHIHVWTEVFAQVQLHHAAGARRAQVSPQDLRTSYSPFSTIEAAGPRLRFESSQ